MRSLRVRTVLAGLASAALASAALAAGASAPAQARVTGIVFQSHVMASWGDAWLGDGTSGRSLYGDIKAVGNNVAQVSAGWNYHPLALRSDGTVWAWGQNNHGQLGDFSRDFGVLPVMVAGLSHATGISAGMDHAVATATNGISAVTSVWTWGANDHGQLGIGNATSPVGPVQVTGLTSATQVAAGEDVSFAVHTVPYLVGL